MRTATLALAAVAALAAAPAARGATGEEVYRQVCSACHAEGKDKAPRLGDRKAWAPLLKEGQSKLTADGWIGVRAMPPQGGRADLPLEDFARAVVYMSRAAGGSWKDPDPAMLANIQKRVKSR